MTIIGQCGWVSHVLEWEFTRGTQAMEESGGTPKGNEQIVSLIDTCTDGLVYYPTEGDIMTGAMLACECPSTKYGNFGTVSPAFQ